MALTFLQSSANSSDLSTYTFSSQNLGTASSNRYIIVAVMARDDGLTLTGINSLTIGGVSATIVVEKAGNDGSGNSNLVALAIAKVGSGTIGNVVVTFNTTVLRCAIGMWRAVFFSPYSPYIVDSLKANGNIDCPAGGFIIGASGGSGKASTWSGITEKYDTSVEGTYYSGASDEFTTYQKARAVSCSSTGFIVFASWGLLGGGILNWWFMRDAWEKHDKIWKPKILKPEFEI